VAFSFLAAASALTWAGVFLAGVLLEGPTLLVVLRASSSAPASLVTLRARFILSNLGVPEPPNDFCLGTCA